MMKKTLIAAFIALAVGGSASAETKITMQSAFGSNLPSLGETGKYFADTVTSISGGDVNIKFEELGAFVGLPEIFGKDYRSKYKL